MRRELLIAAGPGEWRAVWLEDGAPVELHIERGDAPPRGSLHLGRVVRLSGGLSAALIDIGAERPGFLPLRQPLAEGARAIVEIRREARHSKGAQLTTRIDGRRLAPAAERASRLEPPAQLDPPPGFAAALAQRLPAQPDSVVVDDPAPLPELHRAFHDAEIAAVPPPDRPFDIDALFDAALSPTVALGGGGRLHIAESEAAVLIDVDTGSPEHGSLERTALAANVAAAAAIARELRLRQLGGGVVVDFAAAEGNAPRQHIQRALAAALAADPAEPRVLGWTRLGHLELVRPRRHRSLGEAMLDPRTLTKSAATLAFECLRAIAREARAQPAVAWRAIVAAEVAAALRGPAAAGLLALEDRLGRRLAVETAARPAQPAFDIVAR